MGLKHGEMGANGSVLASVMVKKVITSKHMRKKAAKIQLLDGL